MDLSQVDAVQRCLAGTTAAHRLHRAVRRQFALEHHLRARLSNHAPVNPTAIGKSNADRRQRLRLAK